MECSPPLAHLWLSNLMSVPHTVLSLHRSHRPHPIPTPIIYRPRSGRSVGLSHHTWHGRSWGPTWEGQGSRKRRSFYQVSTRARNFSLACCLALSPFPTWGCEATRGFGACPGPRAKWETNHPSLSGFWALYVYL